MGIDWQLTKQQLGDVGPLRHNPYVIKVCQTCQTPEKRRYKGGTKPTAPYHCNKCIANRPTKKQASSEGAKKGWQDPQYRLQIQTSSKSNWQDPKLVARMSKIRQDPQQKAKLIQRNKDQAKDPKWLQAVSQATKKLWQDPQYRNRAITELTRISRRSWLKPEFKQLIQNCMIAQWQDPEYRSKITGILLQNRKNMPRISSLQTTLYSILDDLKVTYYREHQDKPSDHQTVIGPYFFDCVIPRQNKPTLLIECQGEYWHQKENKDRAKASYIQNNFPGQYEIKYLWEHEFSAKDKIASTIKYWLDLQIPDQTEYNLKEVEIRDCRAIDYRQLLSKYHYLANAGRGGIVKGAYLNDTLIAVCVFSPLVRQNIPQSKTTTRELSRLCIHPSYQKRNLASWFVTRCIKSLPPQYKTIISYCDTTFNHDGATYKACNFKLDSEIKPDYWYIDQDGWVMHKKTLYNRAITNQMTERQYASKWGYKKIKGKKKLKFVFER